MTQTQISLLRYLYLKVDCPPMEFIKALERDFERRFPRQINDGIDYLDDSADLQARPAKPHILEWINDIFTILVPEYRSRSRRRRIHTIATPSALKTSNMGARNRKQITEFSIDTIRYSCTIPYKGRFHAAVVTNRKVLPIAHTKVQRTLRVMRNLAANPTASLPIIDPDVQRLSSPASLGVQTELQITCDGAGQNKLAMSALATDPRALQDIRTNTQQSFKIEQWVDLRKMTLQVMETRAETEIALPTSHSKIEQTPQTTSAVHQEPLIAKFTNSLHETPANGSVAAIDLEAMDRELLPIIRVGGGDKAEPLYLEDGNIECSNCHKVYNEIGALRRHMVVHLRGAILCPWNAACNSERKWNRWDHFKNHVRQKHATIDAEDNPTMTRVYEGHLYRGDRPVVTKLKSRRALRE